MKKTGSDMEASKNKFQTIDEYIKTFPKDIQKSLKAIRQAIRKVASDMEEHISYNMPSIKLNGKFLVYFAAWKNHIGLYPVSKAMESSFKELSSYKTSGKGTVQFPLDKPMPLSLIKKIIRFRIKENQEKQKAKVKSK